MRVLAYLFTALSLAACGVKSSSPDVQAASLSTAELYQKFIDVPVAQRTAYFNEIGAFTPSQWQAYLVAHWSKPLVVDGIAIDPATSSGGQTFTQVKDVWTSLGRDPTTINAADIQLMLVLYSGAKQTSNSLQLTVFDPGDADLQQDFCSNFPNGSQMHTMVKLWAELPTNAVLGKYNGMAGAATQSPTAVLIDGNTNTQSATVGTIITPDDPTGPYGVLMTTTAGQNGYADASQPAQVTRTDITPTQFQTVCSGLNRYAQSPEWKAILANGLTQINYDGPRPFPGYTQGVISR